MIGGGDIGFRSKYGNSFVASIFARPWNLQIHTRTLLALTSSNIQIMT